MSEVPYRQDPKPALITCTKCGAPTEAARVVYSKTGDQVCLACDTATDGDERLRRGALGSVAAAYAGGLIATIALWMLLSSLGGGSDHHTSGGMTYYRDSAWKMEMQMTTGWIMFLVVVIGLGAATIAGAHRTLGAPAARKLLGDKRKRYLLYSWAGIPTVPLFFVFWVAVFALVQAGH
jgi:hypothetical protein